MKRDLDAATAGDHEALLAFVNAAPVGLMQTTLDGRVQLANAVCAMLLMPLAGAGGLANLFELLEPWAPSLRERVAAFGAPHGLVCDGERLELTDPGGPLRVASLRLVKLDAQRLMAAFTDVTQQVQAEHARERAEQQLLQARQAAQLSEMKSRFLATMSHELRTPLTSVLGFAELLQHRRVRADSPGFGECLASITRNGRSLLQLINDLLDLSAAHHGQLGFQPERLCLATLAAAVRDELAPGWHAKGHRFTLEVAEGLEALHLDAARLRQVLQALLSNAIKFTPPGGHVALRARPLDDGCFELEVEDNGIGIAEAELPRLFSEFHQLDGGNTRRQEGMGLGLALTRHLVRAQGGDIGVRSRPGKGSVFQVRLPREQA